MVSAPALTSELAAAPVVGAGEDRPFTVYVLAGSAAEVLNLVAPRLSDALFHRLGRRFPDSPAARAHAAQSEHQTLGRPASARPNARGTG